MIAKEFEPGKIYEDRFQENNIWTFFVLKRTERAHLQIMWLTGKYKGAVVTWYPTPNFSYNDIKEMILL